RHRHLQHSRVRPTEPGRRAEPLAARFRAGGAGRRQGTGQDLARAYPAQHPQYAGGAGNDPVRSRHSGRCRPVLCRARRPATDPQLGQDAGRGADFHRLGAACRGRAGARHRADGAGPQPDGRRPARYLRPRAAAEPAMTLLRTRGLSLSIADHPILSGLDIAVEKGEILGLIGESGSGKSMTALSIMQLLPEGGTARGVIELDGADLLQKTEREMCALRGRDIGMVFQEPMTALDPLKPIGEQVAETVLTHTATSRKDAAALARETLDRVGLPAERFPLDRYPHE